MRASYPVVESLTARGWISSSGPYAILQLLDNIALGSHAPSTKQILEVTSLKPSAPPVLFIADPLHFRLLCDVSIPSEARDAVIVAVYKLR